MMLYRKQLMPYDSRSAVARIIDSLWPDEDDEMNFQWVPAVDICEKGDSIQFKVELPGISKDDIELDVANGVLTIRGEKKMEEEKKGETWHRREFRYGTFVRSFTLPTEVKAEEAKATFKDGVLTISIPKEEKALHRKIEIKE